MKRHVLPAFILVTALSLTACRTATTPMDTQPSTNTQPTTAATNPTILPNPTIETNIPDPSVDTSMPIGEGITDNMENQIVG